MTSNPRLSVSIVLAQPGDFTVVMAIFAACTVDMLARTIHQWNEHYPDEATVRNDIDKTILYTARSGENIVGVVTIHDKEEAEFRLVRWLSRGEKPLVIHRLAVHPDFQSRGVARLLMDYAEQYGREHGYTSVRLSAFSNHARVLHFYEQRGYQKVGQVYFSKRDEPFFCLEKLLSNNTIPPLAEE